jgi:hypothetical protein
MVHVCSPWLFLADPLAQNARAKNERIIRRSGSVVNAKAGFLLIRSGFSAPVRHVPEDQQK